MGCDSGFSDFLAGNPLFATENRAKFSAPFMSCEENVVVIGQVALALSKISYP